MGDETEARLRGDLQTEARRDLAGAGRPAATAGRPELQHLPLRAPAFRLSRARRARAAGLAARPDHPPLVEDDGALYGVQFRRHALDRADRGSLSHGLSP